MARSTQSTGGGNYYGHRPGIEYLVPLYQKNKMVQLWKELAPRERSTNLKFIRVMQEGDFGMAPQVTELTGIPFDDFQTPYTLDVTPVKRGIAFAVSAEAIETDQIGVNRNIVPKIARAFAKTKEQVVADFFNNATSSTTAGPDGVSWANDAHPLEDGSVVDNNSTDALSIVAIESMMQRLRKHKSHRGDPFHLMGPYLLMVPPDLEMLARRIVESPNQQGTANNDKNVAGPLLKVHSNPFFTSALAWGIKSRNADEQGLVFLNRRPFRAKRDDDILKDAVVHACTEMYAVYQDDWRGFEYSAGTG